MKLHIFLHLFVVPFSHLSLTPLPLVPLLSLAVHVSMLHRVMPDIVPTDRLRSSSAGETCVPCYLCIALWS